MALCVSVVEGVKHKMKALWFISGMTLGITSLSIAMGSVPSRNQVTDDTVLYQRLSEIRVQKQKDLSFDNDIHRLTQSEHRYREKLPALSDNPRLLGPMSRINSEAYHYTGARQKTNRIKKGSRVRQ